jgi:hypothetical protein
VSHPLQTKEPVMTTTPPEDAKPGVAWPPGIYQVRISGHLDDHWADWLSGHTLSRNDDGTTTLTIPAIDQAQLHGVLGRIRDIGVTLLALHLIGPETAALPRGES